MYSRDHSRHHVDQVRTSSHLGVVSVKFIVSEWSVTNEIQRQAAEVPNTPCVQK